MDPEPPMEIKTAAAFKEILATINGPILPGLLVCLNLKFKTAAMAETADKAAEQRKWVLLFHIGPYTRQYILCDGKEMYDKVCADWDAAQKLTPRRPAAV